MLSRNEKKSKGQRLNQSRYRSSCNVDLEIKKVENVNCMYSGLCLALNSVLLLGQPDLTSISVFEKMLKKREADPNWNAKEMQYWKTQAR